MSKVEAKSSNTSAWISDKYFCGRCGWPAIEVAVNDDMIAYAKQQDPVNGPYADWWIYCSNKGCEHHTGTVSNMFEDPSWTKKILKEE